MASPQVKETLIRYTEDEYLALERQAEERHEYLDGEIYQMAGESPEHGAICTNLTRIISTRLLGTPCQVFSKDTKVRSGRLPKQPRQTKGLYSYPDLLVVCGELEVLDDYRDVLINPIIVIEVVSPSTEHRDRVEKWLRYQTWLPQLQDYLLIAQARPLIEHYNRQPSGGWLYRAVSGLENELHLASIDCTLWLKEVYDRVTFPPLPDEDDEDIADE